MRRSWVRFPQAAPQTRTARETRAVRRFVGEVRQTAVSTSRPSGAAAPLGAWKPLDLVGPVVVDGRLGRGLNAAGDRPLRRECGRQSSQTLDEWVVDDLLAGLLDPFSHQLARRTQQQARGADRAVGMLDGDLH